MKCNAIGSYLNCCIKSTFFNTLLLIAITHHCIGQDSHYSMNHYGTRTALMGGAVMGLENDNTLVYYNPAGLAFIDSATISINASVYQLQNINVSDVIGRNKDFKGSQLGSIPLLVGGMLHTKSEKVKMGYSIMSPVHFNFAATARIDNKVQIVDDAESPGNEEFIGQASVNTKVNEILGVIGVGYKVHSNWSIGLSHLFTVRSQDIDKSNYARFFLNAPMLPLVSSSFVRNANYYHVRYAAKLAVSYQQKNFAAGLTVTTPSLGLFGNATIAMDVIGNNILFEGIRTNLLANDYQTKLKSKYKTPFAVSAGFNWKIRRSLFGLSMSYHGKKSIYAIIQAKEGSFIRPASLYTEIGSENFLRLNDAAKSVFNASIGYEYELKNGKMLYASVRTDQSYYDPIMKEQNGMSSIFSTWDIFHITGGMSVVRNRSKISFGLLYSFGKDKYREEGGNLDTPDESNLLLGSNYITEAKYSSIGLLIGYTFMFKKF